MKKILWNDEKVIINSTNDNGVYTVDDFTGNLSFYDNTNCKVKNASFKIHIKNMKYLDGKPPFAPWSYRVNFIDNFTGIVEEGNLECKKFTGEFNGNNLITGNFTGNFNGKCLDTVMFNGERLK